MAKCRGEKPIAGEKRPFTRREATDTVPGRAPKRRAASTSIASARENANASGPPERLMFTVRERPATSRSGRHEVRHAELESGRGTGPFPRGAARRFGLTVPARLTPDIEAVGIEAPGEDEVSRAVDTLMRLAAVRAREEWERAVEGLQDSPFLDADRLYQAQQHAALRRWVLDEVDLLEPGEIRALLPDRVGTDSNVGRAIDKLRERGELLAVRYKDVWRYPSAQISAEGSVHASIPGLVARARAQGYDPWEIVYWLARPIETLPPPFVGRPLEHDGEVLSLDELFVAAGDLVPESAPAAPGPSPFELLAAGDDDAFGRAVSDWLGQDAP